MLNLSVKQQRFYMAIVLFLIPISGLSVDIYIPSLPAMGHFFNVDKSLVQLSITFYMFGMGLTQIIAGPISDSFGRKKPFIVGMLIYIASTCAIPIIKDIYLLLFMRLLQGISIGLFIVPIRAIMSDLFTGKELQKLMTYMVMTWSIGPIVAPVIGGYLQNSFGWQVNFYFLIVYSSLGFLLVLFFLPETSQYRHDFRLRIIFNNAREILSMWEYFRGLLSNGLLYSIIILFAIVAPFLLQNKLHLSAIQFGHAALFVGLAWFIGSMINRFTLHISSMRKIKLCLWIMMGIDIIMLLLGYFLPLNLYSLMLPLFFMLLLGGVIFPTYFAYAIALFPTKSGSANAFMGAFVFLIPSIVSAFGTLLKANTQIPLALAYLLIIVACLIFTQIKASGR